MRARGNPRRISFRPGRTEWSEERGQHYLALGKPFVRHALDLLRRAEVAHLFVLTADPRREERFAVVMGRILRDLAALRVVTYYGLIEVPFVFAREVYSPKVYRDEMEVVASMVETTLRAEAAYFYRPENLAVPTPRHFLAGFGEQGAKAERALGEFREELEFLANTSSLEEVRDSLGTTFLAAIRLLRAHGFPASATVAEGLAGSRTYSWLLRETRRMVRRAERGDASLRHPSEEEEPSEEARLRVEELRARPLPQRPEPAKPRRRR